MCSLVLSHTGCYGCRMSLDAGIGHEVRYLLVPCSGHCGGGRVHIRNYLGGAYGCLRGGGGRGLFALGVVSDLSKALKGLSWAASGGPQLLY